MIQCVVVTYHRGILIGTVKEGNGEDGNFASRGGP